MMDGLPKYTIKDLMDHGVHFGHQRIRWNPRMKPFIYDTRSGISIVDLRKTLPMLYLAMNKIAEVAADNGRILFVSTKEYMSDYVRQTAQDCAQFYVNYRWLGGTLTNWNTIAKSIDKMRDLRQQLNNTENDVMTKKERGLMEIKLHKLERFFLGIENMKYLPDLIVVLDVYKDYIVVQEAIKKNIQTVAVVDTNGDPTGIQYPVPGNDDSRDTIKFYLDCFRDSVLCGIKVHLDKTAVLSQDNSNNIPSNSDKQTKPGELDERSDAVIDHADVSAEKDNIIPTNTSIDVQHVPVVKTVEIVNTQDTDLTKTTSTTENISTEQSKKD